MKVRLLYVIDSLAPGGAETSLAAMAPGLVKAGIDLHVLPLGSRLDLARQLEEAGAVVHTGDHRQSRFGNLGAVLSTSRTVRPDLIHTTLFEADIAGRTAARLLGIPCTTSLVNDSYGPAHFAESNGTKLRAARAVDTATARFGRRFHAISHAIAQRVPPRIRIPIANVEVIPRGRDPQMFPFRPADIRQATREALRINPDTPVILSVGRLDPQKGHQHLLRALPAIAELHPNAVLLLAGKDGRSAESLHRIAATSPVDVRFLGHRSDIPALLAAADVFCFPSEREGFGGVLVEAMAVGCPIVASSIPTTQEVLSRGGTQAGVLVPASCPQELSRAITQVLDDRLFGADRAAIGRATFEASFSIDVVAVQMADFFKRSQG